MRDAAYWRQRSALLEASAHKNADESVRALEDLYQETQREVRQEIESWYARFARDNQLTLAEAKKRLTAAGMEEFRWSVEQYVKVGKQAGLDPAWQKKLANASARFHISRLEAIELQIQQQIELLYGNQVDEVDELLRKVVGEGYTHTAFEVQKGLGAGWDIAALDPRKLDALLTKPWSTDHKTFRDRCWTNKEALVGEVSKRLTQGLLRGDAPAKTIAAIQKTFGVHRYKAARLVHTETTYFNAVASRQAYQDLDVEQVEIIETLDGRTCEICGDMDGKIIPLSQYEPGVTVPPYHPNCRGTTAPAIDAKWAGKRLARDEDDELYEVPADMTYAQWKEAFVTESPNDDLTKAKSEDIINVEFESPKLFARHYEKHQEEFGGITETEYLEKANQFLREPLSEDVEQLERSDGSISRYKFSTNEFLVVTKEGKLRTYFKPTNGVAYWRYEHERN